MRCSTPSRPSGVSSPRCSATTRAAATPWRWSSPTGGNGLEMLAQHGQLLQRPGPRPQASCALARRTAEELQGGRGEWMERVSSSPTGRTSPCRTRPRTGRATRSRSSSSRGSLPMARVAVLLSLATGMPRRPSHRMRQGTGTRFCGGCTMRVARRRDRRRRPVRQLFPRLRCRRVSSWSPVRRSGWAAGPWRPVPMATSSSAAAQQARGMTGASAATRRSCDAQVTVDARVRDTARGVQGDHHDPRRVDRRRAIGDLYERRWSGEVDIARSNRRCRWTSCGQGRRWFTRRSGPPPGVQPAPHGDGGRGGRERDRAAANELQGGGGRRSPRRSRRLGRRIGRD